MALLLLPLCWLVRLRQKQMCQMWVAIESQFFLCGGGVLIFFEAFACLLKAVWSSCFCFKKCSIEVRQFQVSTALIKLPVTVRGLAKAGIKSTSLSPSTKINNKHNRSINHCPPAFAKPLLSASPHSVHEAVKSKVRTKFSTKRFTEIGFAVIYLACHSNKFF